MRQALGRSPRPPPCRGTWHPNVVPPRCLEPRAMLSSLQLLWAENPGCLGLGFPGLLCLLHVSPFSGQGTVQPQ